MEPGAVDEGDLVEVDHELAAGHERVEAGPRLVDRELVQLALETDDLDSAYLVSGQLDAFHGSVQARG